MSRLINRNSGITLVELLVSIALSGLVLVFIGGLYLFSHKLMIGFQSKSLVNDQRVLLESEIRSALRGLERVIIASDDRIEFYTFQGAVLNMEGTTGANVSINGRPLLPYGMKPGNWKIEYFSGIESGNTAMIGLPDYNDNFEVDGNELSLIGVIRISYSLVYEKTVGESELLLVPRAGRRQVL